METQKQENLEEKATSQANKADWRGLAYSLMRLVYAPAKIAALILPNIDHPENVSGYLTLATLISAEAELASVIPIMTCAVEEEKNSEIPYWLAFSPVEFRVANYLIKRTYRAIKNKLQGGKK